MDRKRFGLPTLFLVWLCITLLFTTVNVHADDVAPPNGAHAFEDFDTYFEETKCTKHGGECCSDKTSIDCQGWFCIEGTCSALKCNYCSEDPSWFCGYVEGVAKNDGMACKYKAVLDQTCNNKTMPCMDDLICSASNNTCQFTPERWIEYQEEVKERRITMIGMIVVLIGMFLAMRRVLKNEENRRRQIWEPVDSSPEASILRRLAEDTQRRVAGGWGQISDSLVEGGNAASAAVGTAFTRIRDNVRNVTSGRNGSLRPEDCDDDTLEMLPNGRRLQTRRELEADMRDFLLEADDDDEDDHRAWDRSRDDDGLLAQHRGVNNAVSSRPSTYTDNTISQVSGGFPDEPPAYDEVRTHGVRQPSLIAGLDRTDGLSDSTSTGPRIAPS
ncbi:hypothetical protein BX616_003497 [Lobosporangium transversale]|nr:hypothetical protein BX616_003497 [Lobosporangium transversale]